MTPKVEFHFDFGSPNAYFVHKLIPAVEKRTGATFAYVPVLLGGVFKLTNNQAPMVQFKGIKNKLEYQQLETRRFISQARAHPVQDEPAFPGQHRADHARGGGGRDGRRARAIRRCRLPAHVGGGQEDGRPGRDPRRARSVRHRRRARAGTHPGPGGQGQAAQEYGSLGCARHVRGADVLRRQRDLLRQGPPARRRGGDRGQAR